MADKKVLTLTDLLDRIKKGDLTVADDLDLFADRLKMVASQMRELSKHNQFASEGGIADRVQIAVVGPDGTVKQRIDTNPEKPCSHLTESPDQADQKPSLETRLGIKESDQIPAQGMDLDNTHL